MVQNPELEILKTLTERQIQLLRVDASFRKKVLKELIKLDKAISSILLDSELSASRQRRYKAVLADVAEAIIEVYALVSSNMELDLTDLADIEALGLSKTLSGAFAGVILSSKGLSGARIKSIAKDASIRGAPSSEWWSRQSLILRNRFKDTIRLGLALGDTNSQIIQRVRGTRAFNYTNGIMESSRREAEALVRSSVQAVANDARLSVFEDASDIIDTYRHVSTLDARTTAQCIVRDGLRWDAKTKDPIGHNIPFQRPPIHWGCRSTIVAEFNDVVLPASAQRASQDGPVKSTITFKEFLEGKSKSFQDELLGKGKAQLWRDGKITLRQLLDQTGNPISLEELRKKYT